MELISPGSFGRQKARSGKGTQEYKTPVDGVTIPCGGLHEIVNQRIAEPYPSDDPFRAILCAQRSRNPTMPAIASQRIRTVCGVRTIRGNQKSANL
jgi:hypothetical protein